MKMAVVGCEASGKTVFMCALADYFGRDAASNPLRLKLTPENPAANGFERYQFRQMRCLRQWPSATPPGRTIELKWSLRHEGNPVATIDLLEFGGETYRAAFRSEDAAQREGSVAELFKYLGDADFFVILVSIKALLANPTDLSQADFDRETEALWVTRGILNFIKTHRPNARAVIGLTQADRYRAELDEAGGPERLFAGKWPTVAAGAAGIPVVEVASVSRTDDAGNPAEGYSTRGIVPVMRLFAKQCFGNEEAIENGSLATVGKKKGNAGNLRAKLFTVLTAVAALGILGGLLFYGLPPIKSSFQKTAKDTARHPVETKPILIERVVTNTIEKVLPPSVMTVTNTVETFIDRFVTNTVEKVVEKPVTNTVETFIDRFVTNTVEKVIEKPVTNIVERIVTNVIETVAAPKPDATGFVKVAEALPPGYREWTDRKGVKVVAKWVGIAADKSSITIITRHNRRMEAVLRKFSEEDQAFVKDEIKRHEDAGEVMSNGVWIKNPMLKD